MFWFYLLLIVSLVSLVMLPYEKVAIRRIIFVRELMRICKQKNINYKVMNAAYPFSKNEKDEFDLVIRVGETVIPVKFFSATGRHSTIIFDKSGRICIRCNYIRPFFRNGKSRIKTVKKYCKMPQMRISKKIIGNRYKCYPVFLNEPGFSSLKLADEKGGLCDFYDTGGKIAGCNLIDAKTFLDLVLSYSDVKEKI